jgi:hypothetical protein
MTRLSRTLLSCVMSIAFLASSLPSMACSEPPGYGFIIHSILQDFTKGPPLSLDYHPGREDASWHLGKQ